MYANSSRKDHSTTVHPDEFGRSKEPVTDATNVALLYRASDIPVNYTAQSNLVSINTAPPRLQAHGELPPALSDFLLGEARWDARLAAWLLWQSRCSGALWRSYFAALPRLPELSNLLTFSPDEHPWLEFPDLAEEARVQYDWAAQLHKRYFSASGGELASLRLSSSLEESLWALACVRSRSFSENAPGGEGVTLMVPFADLANHAQTNNCTFAMARDAGRFELRTLRVRASGPCLCRIVSDRWH